MRSGLTVLAASFVLSSAGVAGELPKSGSIEGRFYSHNVQKIDELATADGMKSYVNEAFEFHVGTPPGGDPFDGTTGRCLGYGRYSEESGAVKETGRCTMVDTDGDQISEEYDVDVAGPDDNNPIKVTLLGGTGKYKGISGTLTSTVEMWPALGKGDTMWAGDYKGEYKIND
jgi:hypothetical protein